MNFEFHYCAVRYLCECAGFEARTADRIAISSQLVDECTLPWEIQGGPGVKRTLVTQNYQFWDESVIANVYRPFHFLPGDRALAASKRRDRHAGRQPVTADSSLARELLIAALKTKNPYRIGIALHAYADTWAHQNFSADREAANAFDPDSALPAVGHMHARSLPDDPQVRWIDARLEEPWAKVDNRLRFLDAARMIYRFLRTSRKEGFEDEDYVLERLDGIWKLRMPAAVLSPKDREARASSYVVDLGVPPWENDAWARAAGAVPSTQALASIKGVIPFEGYRGSEFEAWNDAAAAHRELCRTSFAQRGIR
jgi:hypothetical protein